jgi:hypothetical protein
VIASNGHIHEAMVGVVHQAIEARLAMVGD